MPSALLTNCAPALPPNKFGPQEGPPVGGNNPVPLPFAKGKTLLSVSGTLAASDPTDPRKKGCHHKTFLIDLAVEKTSIIELIQGTGSELDPYLRIEDQKGQILAEDDDSGGDLNARIVFKAPTTAKYRIVVTSCGPGMTGDFTLSVFEAAEAKGKTEGDPKLVPRQKAATK